MHRAALLHHGRHALIERLCVLAALILAVHVIELIIRSAIFLVRLLLGLLLADLLLRRCHNLLHSVTVSQGQLADEMEQAAQGKGRTSHLGFLHHHLGEIDAIAASVFA